MHRFLGRIRWAVVAVVAAFSMGFIAQSRGEPVTAFGHFANPPKKNGADERT